MHIRSCTHLKFMEEYKSHTPMYTTPKTLFCTGFSVDNIREIGIIPRLSHDNDRSIGNQFFQNVHNQRRMILSSEERPTSDSSNSRSEFDDWVSMIIFFALQQEYSAPEEVINSLLNTRFEEIEEKTLLQHEMRDFNNFLDTRFEEIKGKTYFITGKGFVGIATAPVQNGDSLNLLHDSGVYFILREIKDQGDEKVERKHRIVARAAIDDKAINYPEWVKSFPRLNFQIV
ncbi:hypothetical protein F4679DRAFT_539994 [Xylaria curta]|nr:hypothetical protein F4679DRAFT_539994 [Xylaria curta]